jgi:serine/threonine protein kinase/tetratricopeptide (TPR) repeat protein
MSEIRTCANGHQWAEGEDPCVVRESVDVCPACGAIGEVVTPDVHAGLTAVDGELPPPPCPLPGAVAQVAAGLLLQPERAGRAGLPTVAGYEILAPLGRGGMGLVYQARQLRFGRVVALKMIRGGAHANPRDLARFRTEAAAVARLEHPNIVPIYEVGEQDGWAYFALEFVPGGSLARHLAGRPQPAGPSAQLVETLARAMDYAHVQGIVHRDLKPANILLQKSEIENPKSERELAPAASDFGFRISDFGFRISDFSPKVTDFGLAKRLDPEPGISNACERTATGEILGTPSYMAPEQTWGRPGEVGPAADVYALGAILYECLTGRPPFQAATPLDTLLQVRTEEPVPPRRLVPAVPRDLETICLKCLHKEPRRRYASAGALAEDLRRFLDGAPVRARPVRAWERTVRWARRRRAVAALAACSGAAVLALVVFGVWHYVQLQGYNAELRTERNTADRLRELAQSQEAEARHQKDEAERQWQRAEANFKNALDAVVQMLARVSEDETGLAHEPRMEQVRQKLLDDALRFCQDLLKQKGTDRLTRQETAAIHLHIGDLQKRLGRQAAAEAAYRAAIELYQTLAGEFPGRPAYRFELAGCYTNLGNLLADSPRRKEAEEAYRRALEVQEALVREDPDEAEYRSDLAGNQHNLGTLMLENGQLAEAEPALRQALDHRRRLAEQHPQNAAFRQDVARTQNNLGMVLRSADRNREAEQEFRQALDLQRRLVEEFPRVPAYRQELAGSHNCLAGVLIDGNELPEAETQYGHALALQQRLAEEFPRVPDHRRDLASTHHNLALLLERMQRLQKAEQAHRRALDLFRGLVEEVPEVPGYQNMLGDSLAHLARVLRDQGRLADARRDAEEALRHQLSALKLVPGHPRFTYSLAGNYAILAETLVRLGDHEAAAKAAAELPRHFPKKGSAYCQAAAFLARCVPLAEQDPMLPPDKRKAQADAYGDQALALLRQGLRHPPGRSAEQLASDPHFAPLRPRADFRQLLRELEEAAR